MANQAKKNNAGNRNPDRKNGKAWKKNPAKPRVRTESRQEKDALIRQERAVKRQEGMVRHAAEMEILAHKTSING